MSSTAEIIKLTAVGSSITLVVDTCAKVPVGQYPEWEFVGHAQQGNVAVRVPESAFTRQMTRLGLTAETVRFKTITISRDPNAASPAKPYWGINLAGDAAVMAPAAHQGAKTYAAPKAPVGHDIPPVDLSRFPFDRDEMPEPEQPKESGAALYEKITRYVLTKIVPIYDEHGYNAIGEDTVAAIVATLYIQANKR